MKKLLDNPRVRTAAGAIFIVVATFVAYWPAIQSGFIWDDDTHVTENPLLRDPPGPADQWDGLRLIWSKLGATPQYYPLTHTSFWIEYGIWGDNPRGYHVVNVALHVANALLLWRVLTVLGMRGAWLAAALFALHPIEVESVAWVTERKNVLSGVFYFGALLSYLRASGIGGDEFGDQSGGDESGAALRGLRSAPAWRWYLVSLLLFVCAALSKTVAATLPGAILLMLWWTSGTVPWRHVLFLLPMFVVAAVMGSLTGWMERTYVGAVGPEWDHSFVERCLIAGRAAWFYVRQIIYPARLIFIYPRWDVDATVWWQYLFPLSVVAVVLILFLLRNRLGRGPLVAVLFYLGTLFPALGFVNVYPHRFSFVADHFQYVAGVGLIALLAECVARCVGRAALRRTLSITWPVVLGALTWLQCHTYRDARTLWQTTLDRNPGAWIAHDHLGEIIGTSDPESAKRHYADAIELKPDHVEAYVGLANLLLQTGDANGAAEQYRRATEVRPDKPAPYYGLGGALAAAGNLAGAVDAYERALAVDPKFVPARLRLVDLYTRLGRGDDAARHRNAARQQLRDALGR